LLLFVIFYDEIRVLNSCEIMGMLNLIELICLCA